MLSAHKRTPVNQYIYKLTRSLNHAIAVSLKRNPQSVNSQFVRSIILVKGVHFYGFHSSYTPFLKILLADPAYINRAATIMQSGTVMHMPFRVYETHISFILQFLCDFGLYGCGWMDLGEVLQRAGDAVFDENGVEVISELLFPPSSYFRHSRMPLEIDVAAHQIFNRHKLTARNLHHKFTIPAPPLPAEPLVPSVRELWEDERRRRATKGLNPSPELPVDPTERSRGTGGEWVAEVRYWDGIKKRIEHEREHEFSIEPKETWEQWVMTTFESVEALWEDQWKTWRPEKLAQKQGGEHISESEERAVANPFGTAVGQASQDVKATAGGEGEEAELEVDEATLASQALRQLVQGAEEQVPEEQEPMDVEDVDVFQDQEDEENHPPSVDAKVLAGRATSGGVSKDDVRLPDGTSTSMDVPPSVRTPTKGPMKRSNAFGTAFGKMAM